MAKAETGKVIDMTPSGDPTVAVAFGGGGARGYAHIHIIEILDEFGIRPVAISGSSIGAIMGAAMASGMTGKAIRDYSLELAANKVDVAARMFKMRPSGLTELAANRFRIGQFDIDKILNSFLPDEIGDTFEDLSIPLSIVATDYYACKQCVVREGPLMPALAASAAIPAIFHPVKLNGRFHVDGGIFNPVPWDHLDGLADIVVGIDVMGVPSGDETRVPTAIESIYGTTQLMQQSIIQLKLQLSRPDIFLQPPVSKYRVQDLFKVKQILSDTEVVRDEFRRELEAALNRAARKSR